MKLWTFFKTTYRYSPLRTFEDETLKHFLSTLPNGQHILDLGGGKKSDYAPLFSSHTLDSLNISQAMHPTIVADLMKPLPIADASYDLIISMNTLEHIPALIPALPEAHRTLKPNGTLFLTLPFLHHTHGLPNDYARYSSSSLELTLNSCGYTHIHIKPLGHGAFTACASNLHGIFPRFLKILRPILCGSAYALDSILFFLSKKYRAHFGPTVFPLGYAITAKKP